MTKINEYHRKTTKAYITKEQVRTKQDVKEFLQQFMDRRRV